MNEYMKENCKKAGWSVTEGNGQLRFLTDDCIGYEVLAKETDLDTVAMLCSAYTPDMTAAPAAYTRHCKIKDSLTRLAEAIRDVRQENLSHLRQPQVPGDRSCYPGLGGRWRRQLSGLYEQLCGNHPCSGR